MLGRLLGRPKPDKPRSRGSRDQRSTSLSSKDGYETGRLQNQNAERELYKYEAPQQSLGMSDLIKSHEQGTRFLYAAVTGNQGESSESRLRRLIQFQPSLNKRSIPIENLPQIPLFKETENFPIDSLIRSSKNEERPYVRIADAIVMYGALISVDSEFTKIHISIMDDRVLNQKCAKTMTATSNVMCKANLALSYCFPKAEASCISLSITRENRFMEEGKQWGVVKIELVLEELAFPVQTDNEPVVATNTIPRTLLEERQIDPDKVDISITNSDRAKLSILYMDGDIADSTEPVLNKTEVTKYAKSTLAGPRGRKPTAAATSDWDFMDQKRIANVDADQNSVIIEADGSVKSGSDMAAKLSELKEEQEGALVKHVKTSVKFKETDGEEAPIEKRQLKSAMKRPGTPPGGLVDTKNAYEYDLS